MRIGRMRVTTMWNPGFKRRMEKRLCVSFILGDWPGVTWAAKRLIEYHRHPDPRVRYIEIRRAA